MPEELSPCIEWPKSRFKYGYGARWFRGAMWRAHRVAWTIERGEIPEGLHVLHRCDNRACVNVAHLFLGTNADNVADMNAKRRAKIPLLRGERHAMSKLTSEKVLEIRDKYAKGGITQKELASEYGVDHTTISLIVRRKIWSHI